MLSNKPCLHAQLLKSKNSNLVIFPKVGAFEQLFSPVRGEFEKFFKNSNARGERGGLLKLQFDWYIIAFLTYIFLDQTSLQYKSPCNRIQL